MYFTSYYAVDDCVYVSFASEPVIRSARKGYLFKIGISHSSLLL